MCCFIIFNVTFKGSHCAKVGVLITAASLKHFVLVPEIGSLRRHKGHEGCSEVREGSVSHVFIPFFFFFFLLNNQFDFASVLAKSALAGGCKQS